MSRFYLDVPNSFNVTSYHDHEEVRRTYQTIIDVALELELELVTRRAPAYLDNVGVRQEGPEGMFYAYHARVDDEHAYCIKGGPLTDLWYFDPKGYSGWCSMAQDSHLQEAGTRYNLQVADQTLENYRHKFLHEGFSRQKQDDTELSSEIEDLGSFVFYPLQLDYDQVLKLSEFTQVEIIATLVKLAEQHQQHIVIKRHPLCDSTATEQVLEEVSSHPKIHISEASIHKLIPASDKILVSNSSVGLQALIHGKPVFSMAASEYAHMTDRVNSIDELSKLFEPVQEPQSERIRQQLGYLLNVYLVDTRDRDAIKRRVVKHMNLLRRHKSTSEPKTTTPLSILHLAKKELGETIALLLMDFANLTGARRQHVSRLLLRAARNGLHLNRIIQGTDAEFWKQLSHQLIKKNDLKRAERVVGKMVAELPVDSATQLVYSKIMFGLGKDEEGLLWARSAAECDGNNADALVFLGRKLASGGADTEALQLARDAVELEPRHPMANWLKAKLLYQNGEVGAALEASAIAAAEQPDVPNIKSLHKRILEAHGDTS